MKRGTLPVEFSDNITESTIDGKQFYRLDNTLHFPGATVPQAFVSTKLDKHILSFILTGQSQEALDVLNGTLDSLRFSTGSH